MLAIATCVSEMMDRGTSIASVDDHGHIPEGVNMLHTVSRYGFYICPGDEPSYERTECVCEE